MATVISTWVHGGEGSSILVCSSPTGPANTKKLKKMKMTQRVKKMKQKKELNRTHWRGQHHESRLPLRLVWRKDRKPLIVLLENEKHILCAQVDACGATVN